MKTICPALVFAALAVTACNAEPPTETVLDDQLETLDRARGVQTTLDEHATELQQRLEGADEDEPHR